MYTAWCLDYPSRRIIQTLNTLLSACKLPFSDGIICPHLLFHISYLGECTLLAYYRPIQKGEEVFGNIILSGDDSVNGDGILLLVIKDDANTYEPSKETKNGITCHECIFYSFVCHVVRSTMINGEYFLQSNPEKVEDTLAVCRDIKHQLQSYMAHKVWCTNQNIAIKSIENNMVTKLNGPKEVMSNIGWLLTSKWSLNLYHQGKPHWITLDHHGKRGIGWHGVYFLFYQSKERETDNGTKEHPVEHSVYIDQIMGDSNQQDMFCVFSILGAALQQIHCNSPFISKMILQSNNVKFYQSTLLICSISLSNASYQHCNLKIT